MTDKLKNPKQYFFKKKKECLNNKKWVQTNKKYPHFKQVFFTAGDPHQFKKYGLLKTRKLRKREKKDTYCLSKNLFLGKKLLDTYFYINFYNEIDLQSISNTFKYIFFKFKKGIYIKIHNNKLAVFLPFSNVDYKNEFYDYLTLSKKYKSDSHFLSRFQEFSRRRQKLLKDKSRWFSNNCLIRAEDPKLHGEGDANHRQVKHMFSYLCKKRKVDNVEFFVNSRDFPIIKKDLTEPYHHIYNSKTFPLISHKYSDYCPILSYCSGFDYADIPIPTNDDWEMVSKLVFPDRCNDNYQYYTEVYKNWDSKIPTAVFRGSSTGCGSDIKTNPRIHLAYLSKKWSSDDNYNENNKVDQYSYLDAGITKWNTNRIRKETNKNLDFGYSRDILDIGERDYIKMRRIKKITRQSEYKYILIVDGHSAPFHTAYRLSFKSLPLIVESDYTLWFYKLLKPNYHYIPIKKDLSDLKQKIYWCKKNDDKCRIMAQRSYNFYKKYLCKNGVLDYLQLVINRIAQNKKI